MECLHIDTCLPDYWPGHSSPHISVPVSSSMTLEGLIWSLRSELNQCAVSGSNPPADDDDAWYDEAVDAVHAMELKPGSTRPFPDLEEPEDEFGDYVYAYFVFE